MNRIKLLRYERGLGLKEAARMAGVGSNTLAMIESGRTTQPTAGVSRKLATFYGVPMTELLGVVDPGPFREALGSSADTRRGSQLLAERAGNDQEEAA